MPPHVVAMIRSMPPEQLEELLNGLEGENDQEIRSLDKRLKKNPNDVKALVERSGYAQSPEEAASYLERAVPLMAKALGGIEKYIGRGATNPKIRDYIDARFDLGLAWIMSDKQDQGFEALEELLRIDPDDDHGARFRLLKEYVDHRRWDSAEALVAQFSDDPFPDLTFTAVLLEFRKNGDSARAHELLRRAVSGNRFVVTELLGESEPFQGDVGQQMISPSSPNAAALHGVRFRAAWRSMPGAISWLRTARHPLDVEETPKTPKATAAKIKKQLQACKKKIKKTEFYDESWIIDVAPVADVWSVIIVDTDSMSPVQSFEFDERPTNDEVLLKVCEWILNDDDHESGRPESILVLKDELLDTFSDYFDDLDVLVGLHEHSDELGRLSNVAYRADDIPDVPMDQVPQVPDLVWEVDWRLSNTWVPDDTGELKRPWLGMVVDPESEIIVQTAMDLVEPTPEFVASVMRRAVLLPAFGDPTRPSKIIVSSGDNGVLLNAWLEEANVDCEVGEVETIERIQSSVNSELFEHKLSPLLEIEGVTPELANELYVTAVALHKAEPWMKMRPADYVSISVPQLSPLTWYAGVMGQNGEGLGIILFDNEKTLRLLLRNLPGDFRGLSLTLEEKQSIHPLDLEAAEQFGWPVATTESWPLAVRINGEDGFGDLQPGDLPLLIVTASAVLDYWKNPAEARRRTASVQYQYAVPGISEPVRVDVKLFK